MKKIILGITLMVLGLTSCANPNKITVEELVSINIEGFSKIDISATVENCSAHKVEIRSGRFTLYRNDDTFGEVMITAPVIIPKCSKSMVTLPFRFRISDPLSLLTMSGDPLKILEGVTVSGEAVVKGGWAKKKITFKNKPISKIIDNFESAKLNLDF